MQAVSPSCKPPTSIYSLSSPSAWGTFQPTPGLISYPRVTGRWGLLSLATWQPGGSLGLYARVSGLLSASSYSSCRLYRASYAELHFKPWVSEVGMCCLLGSEIARPLLLRMPYCFRNIFSRFSPPQSPLPPVPPRPLPTPAHTIVVRISSPSWLCDLRMCISVAQCN